MNEQFYSNKIEKYLGWLTSQVRISSNNGYHDINKYAEKVFPFILNPIFKADFKRLEHTKKNQEAIDLGCSKTRISVQVTSTKKAKKIKHTLETFIRHQQYQDYDHLYILIIAEEYTPSIKEKNIQKFIDDLCVTYKVTLPKSFSFSIKNVWNISTLRGEVDDKLDIDELRILQHYLSKQYTIPINEEDISEEFKNIIESLNSQVKQQPNFLDALFYIVDAFEGLLVLPSHVLFRLYPFSLKKNRQAYYLNFTLYTHNEELFTFFSKLVNGEDLNKIKPQNMVTDELETKLKKLISIFNHNLIRHICLVGKEKERVCIHNLFSNEVCDCERCSYKRFEIQETVEKLSDSNDDLSPYEALRNAFTHTQLGNFRQAYNLYRSLSKQLKKDRKYIGYFICQFNLSKLALLINRRYFEKDRDKMLTTLNKIDLNEILYGLKKFVPYEKLEVLRWISHTKFVTRGFWKIDATLQEILSVLQSDQNGGWSGNYYEEKLLHHLAQVSVFLEGNLIIYDSFSEYATIVEKATEGYVALSRLQNPLSDKLEYFDDFIVNAMFRYADAEKLDKIFNKYNLKNIDYKSTAHKSVLNFTQKLLNIFQSVQVLNRICHKDQIPPNYFLRDKIAKAIANALIILSRINLSIDTFSELIDQLIEFIRQQTFINSNQFKSLQQLIRHKAEIISTVQLYAFLELLIDKKLPAHGLISTISVELSLKEPKFVMKDEDFEQKIWLPLISQNDRIAKTDCDKLIDFYRIVTVSQQTKIKNLLRKKLKDSFNTHLYFFAVHEGIIDYQEFLKVLISHIPKHKNESSFIEIFGNKKDTTNTRLNRLISIAYQYNINLQEEKYQELHQNIPYYEWLMNLDTFDYSKFEPYWLLQYPSTTYYLKFKQYPPIHAAIKKAMMGHYSEGLARIYFEYFLD